MDYQAMWKRLIEEMDYLIIKEVRAIDPRIVLGYIGFLEEIERYKDEQGDKS